VPNTSVSEIVSMMESLTSDQVFIREITEIILANIENGDFSADDLAHKSGINRGRLKRKISAVSKKTVNQFIREVRLTRALEILKNNDLTVSEVAYRTGFSSPAYFNRCFHELFGYPPGKVKNVIEISQEENENIPVTNKEINQRSFWSIGIRILSVIIIVPLLILIFALPDYNFVFKPLNLEKKVSNDNRISVIVMPFQNMTDDPSWNIRQGGILDIFTNTLSGSNDELIIIHPESVNSILQEKNLTDYASITPSSARKISKKLDADFFIYGSINQVDSTLQLIAQLIGTETGEVARSFDIEGNLEKTNILEIADSLSVMVRNHLIISSMEKGIHPDLRTYQYYRSPEAYEFFLLGSDALIKRNDNLSAINSYSRAVALDSNYIYAIIFLSLRYEEMGLYNNAREWCLKAYSKRDLLPAKERVLTDLRHAELFGTIYDRIKSYKQFLEDIDDQVPYFNFALGIQYNTLKQYDRAIPEFKKALKTYNNWDIKPKFMNNYTALMHAYHETGQFLKEKRLFKKAEQDFPHDPSLLYRQQAIFEFARQDTTEANQYINKYRSALKDLSWSEPDIITSVGFLYQNAGIINKAEEFLRQALYFEPDNPVRINNLAYLLIDKELDINKGLALIDSALKLRPDNHNFMHTKGWGLFK